MIYPKEYRLAVEKVVRGITTDRLRVILAKYTGGGIGVQYHADIISNELTTRAESPGPTSPSANDARARSRAVSAREG
jgi:hypothetical protein